MPLYTDMIMDNFEDYANHHEDDGVIKLQNMPEDASMEQWGAKLQEIADEFICAPRYFLMCWLASYCLDEEKTDFQRGWFQDSAWIGYELYVDGFLFDPCTGK